MSDLNKLHHFYHIYADGQWEEPVSEHIKALRKWSLIDNLASFKVGIVGADHNRTAVIQYLINERINFDVIAQADTGWEQVTQIPMYNFAQSNDGYVLYAHSKGSSSPEQPNKSWRRSMTYYNVGQWQIAVQKLNDGFDAVGQHWMRPSHHSVEHRGSPFFGGTFWWTSFEHIRKMLAPPVFNRHDAEGWIGYVCGEDMKCFDFTGHISAHPCYSLWTMETQQWIYE